jgi:hypothetical protein
MARTKIKHIGIIGRRWQDSNGNTYNTAEIYVNGPFVHKVPFGYGYGSHYEERAVEWLEKNGYIDRKDGGKEAFWRIAERMGFSHDSQAIDVPRKKDL